MKRNILLIILFLLISACTKTPKPEPIVDKPILPEATEPSLVLYPSLETRAPNTDFKPAFEGQTRAASTQTQISYSYSILNQELVEP